MAVAINILLSKSEAAISKIYHSNWDMKYNCLFSPSIWLIQSITLNHVVGVKPWGA